MAKPKPRKSHSDAVTSSPKDDIQKDIQNPDYTKYIMPLELIHFLRGLQDNLLYEARLFQDTPESERVMKGVPHHLRQQFRAPKRDLTPYEELVGMQANMHRNAEIKTGAYDLPRPGRNQDTHGYSWVAHTQAAFLAGVQPPAFSLSALDSLVQTGLDYWSNKIEDWREFPEEFIRDAEAMLKHDWRQCSILHLPPRDCHGEQMPPQSLNEIHINLVLEELAYTAVKQLSRYAEIRRCLAKLRELGMAEEGMKARQQVTRSGRIQTVWQQLRSAAIGVMMTTRWQARTAFAGGPGRHKVKRNLYPITIVNQKEFDDLFKKLCPAAFPHLDEFKRSAPGGWFNHFLDELPMNNVDLRYDSHLEEDRDEDWFTSALAGYCLYPSDFRWVDDQVYIKRSKLYSELEFEQAKLANMEEYHKLDPFFQRLLSEQNAATDLWDTLNLIYPPDANERDYQSPFNAPGMRSSAEYDSVSKKLKASFIATAVLGMGKKHPVAETLPPRPDRKFFKLASLFGGTQQARTEAAGVFWEIIEDGMEAAFEENWFEIMYKFEFGQDFFDNFYEDLMASLDQPGEPQSTPHQTANTSFPVTTEPLAISGHRYRAMAGFESQCSAQPTNLKDSFDEAGLDDKESKGTFEVRVEEAQPDAPYTVTGKQMKLVKRLFDHHGEQVGMVRWFDLDKLMKRLGFRVETKSGSVVTWIPPKGMGQPMNVHRPHPDNAVGPKNVGRLVKRLKAKYGWSIDSFKRSAADSLCGCLGSDALDDSAEAKEEEKKL